MRPERLHELALLCGGMALLIGGVFLSTGGVKSLQRSIALINSQKSLAADVVDYGGSPGTYTWTVPSGVSSVYVQIIGGGGGGAGDQATGPPCDGFTTASGAAGGVYTITIGVTPGQQFSVVVGAGGAGGPTAYNCAGQFISGSAGGTSSFGSYSASGGSPGVGLFYEAPGGNPTVSGTRTCTYKDGNSNVHSFTEPIEDGCYGSFYYTNPDLGGYNNTSYGHGGAGAAGYGAGGGGQNGDVNISYTVSGGSGSPPPPPTSGPSCTISSITSPTGSGSSATVNYSVSNSPSSGTVTYSLPSGVSITPSQEDISNFNATSFDTGVFTNNTGSNQTATINVTVSNSSGSGSCSGTTIVQSAPPTVTTNTVTNNTGTSTTLNGTLTSLNAGPNATAEGFKWSTSQNMFFGVNTVSVSGNNFGAGAFSANISGLTRGTTYYYYAYATNNNGTGVGNELSFVAGSNPPTVTTDAPTNTTPSSVTLQGDAVPNGNSTTASFAYSTSNLSCSQLFSSGTVVAATPSPIGSDFGDYTFSAPINGLTAQATYFYCAVATNSSGTSYGNVWPFVAQYPPPSMSLSASPASVSSGNTSSLTWTITNLHP